jgi:hypothetical protein
MKTILRNLRRCFFSGIPYCFTFSFLVFLFFTLNVRAEDDIVSPDSMQRLKIAIAECDSNVTQMRQDLPALKALWAKLVPFAKESKRLNRLHEQTYQEMIKASNALDQAAVELEKLRERCRSAYRMSGRTEYEFQERWQEVKECIEFAEFHAHVYEVRKSSLQEKNKAVAEVESKMRQSSSSLVKLSNEYKEFAWRYKYGLSEMEIYGLHEIASPEGMLRRYKGHCDELHLMNIMKGYDPGVRAVAAIKDCRFTDADRYVAEMPMDTARAGLERNVAQARARAQQVYRIYQEGKDLYNRGKTEESSGGFDRARSFYQEALAKFGQARDLERCESRLPAIYNALSVVGKRISGLQVHETRQRQEKTQIFHKPTIGGLPIDACYQWAKDCEKPAADEFCRRNGFSGAASWKTDEPMPRTRIISSGQICETGKNWRSCGGFTVIECK